MHWAAATIDWLALQGRPTHMVYGFRYLFCFLLLHSRPACWSPGRRQYCLGQAAGPLQKAVLPRP